MFWNVHDAEVGGSLSWADMPLTSFGEEMLRLAGDTADVSLDFRVPFGERPTTVLRAESEFAELDIRGEPDTVAVAAIIQDALEVRADLDRDEDGRLDVDEIEFALGAPD